MFGNVQAFTVVSSIRQIARLAQVSPATVSSALSGRKGVNAQTRQRVEEVAQRIGYKPRGRGRPSGSRRREVRNFGVVCGVKGAGNKPDADGGWMGNEWIAGIREALLEREDHFSLFAGFEHIDQDAIFRQSLESGQLDGVILLWPSDKDGYLDALLATDMPLVVINRRPHSGQAFSYVEMDNADAGRQVADFFVSQGHRRIGVVSTDERFSYHHDRVAGLEYGLAMHGLAPIAREVIESPIAAPRVAEALLSAGATAVFATSTRSGMACLNAWTEAGVRVPQDVSIIAFDNVSNQSRAGLRLSSVAYDHHQIGRCACRVLRELIDHRPRVNRLSVSLPTRIVGHDTTAPPTAEPSP